jgi:hypothetical protein
VNPFAFNRSHRRRWLMALSTLLGLGKKGFFLPYRYAASVRPIAYPGLEPAFSAAMPDYRRLLGEM